MKSNFFRTMENVFTAVVFAEGNQQDYALFVMSEDEKKRKRNNKRVKRDLRQDQRPRMTL